jgi:hypothetical protein
MDLDTSKYPNFFIFIKFIFLLILQLNRELSVFLFAHSQHCNELKHFLLD